MLLWCLGSKDRAASPPPAVSRLPERWPLSRAEIPGLTVDPNQLLFFVGRPNGQIELAAGDGTMARAPLFRLLRIATGPTEFFRIPPDRVIELGAEIEI